MIKKSTGNICKIKEPNEIWFLTSELEAQRAGSFRQERWCELFLECSFTIKVFNISGALGINRFKFTNVSDFKSFRKNSLLSPRGLNASIREGLFARILRRIKHLFLIDLFLPNVVCLTLNLIFAVMRRDHPIIVMASSPPFSLVLVLGIIKWFNPEKVVSIIDMRDAWALHNALGGVKWLKKKIERFALVNSNYLLTVSKGLAQEFSNQYGIKCRVMYNVATHYHTKVVNIYVDWSKLCDQIDTKRILLVYTGSTPIGHYDVGTIVRGITKLRARNQVLANKIQTVFIGACGEVQKEFNSIRNGTNDIVFVRHLSHTVCRSIQAQSSALIFLGHTGCNNSGVVSTKIFEYLALAKPIMPLCLHSGSDVDELLVRFCGQSFNVHTDDEICNLLEKVAVEGPEILPKIQINKSVDDLFQCYREFVNELNS